MVSLLFVNLEFISAPAKPVYLGYGLVEAFDACRRRHFTASECRLWRTGLSLFHTWKIVCRCAGTALQIFCTVRGNRLTLRLLNGPFELSLQNIVCILNNPQLSSSAFQNGHSIGS
jgi:hypothetical protein